MLFGQQEWLTNDKTPYRTFVLQSRHDVFCIHAHSGWDLAAMQSVCYGQPPAQRALCFMCFCIILQSLGLILIWCTAEHCSELWHDRSNLAVAQLHNTAKSQSIQSHLEGWVAWCSNMVLQQYWWAYLGCGVLLQSRMSVCAIWYACPPPVSKDMKDVNQRTAAQKQCQAADGS